jgi:hypothetical protein
MVPIQGVTQEEGNHLSLVTICLSKWKGLNFFLNRNPLHCYTQVVICVNMHVVFMRYVFENLKNPKFYACITSALASK